MNSCRIGSGSAGQGYGLVAVGDQAYSPAAGAEVVGGVERAYEFDVEAAQEHSLGDKLMAGEGRRDTWLQKDRPDSKVGAGDEACRKWRGLAAVRVASVVVQTVRLVVRTPARQATQWVPAGKEH